MITKFLLALLVSTSLVLAAPAESNADDMTMMMITGSDDSKGGLLESLRMAGIGPKQILESVSRLREVVSRAGDNGGGLLTKIFDTANLPQTGVVDNTVKLLAIKNTVENLLSKLLPANSRMPRSQGAPASN